MKTYIIHYSPLKERRQHMEQLLECEWILEDPAFITVLDRETLTVADLANFAGTTLMASDKSLIGKHILAWKLIKDISIVLEDDVILAPDFSDTLSKYMDELPEDWDLLFIGNGCNMHIPSEICSASKSNVFPKSVDPSTWGGDGATRCTDSYVIHPKCAARFGADPARPITKSIDFYMNDLCRKYDCKVFWAEPTIVSQGSETGLFEVSTRK